MEESLRGKLLVASPSLLDPNFHRTVVLIAEHGERGAMGLVLNRPSSTPVTDAVPELEEIAAPGEPVFIGGPVRGEAFVVLADFSDPTAAAWIVAADVGLVAAGADTGDLAAATRRARVFAGHSGWGGGQLEAEIETESWIVEPPLPRELLCDRPESLWSDVLARKGGPYALMSRMPADPSLN